MISRGFAANDIIKFGDNRTKGIEIKGWGKFVEYLESPITQKLKFQLR